MSNAPVGPPEPSTPPRSREAAAPPRPTEPSSGPVDDRVWRLRRRDDGEELARLVVTGGDMPWLHARVEALPGLAEFEPLFAEQERALEAEDWEADDACYQRIRAALTLTFPDGRPVPEFLLHLHGDGTAGWRWHHEPFPEPDR
ncbi:hypothetical protein RM844_10920 [Streptomyces sp. DSM 44915]|uniref:Uncharacterized protein n=1 Tax=Streptomyces chisholmiae TaxID=3075540 RepID=A0ABU2JP92_9ACTN|nr:hypothetical protein [Streptomyces sp. DSM 44915]MDT0266804.1 hypothetical protein [Streptomyces sp. DSM 44915]